MTTTGAAETPRFSGLKSNVCLTFVVGLGPPAMIPSLPALTAGGSCGSFGEIFAGVLKDSGRAKVVGETSLGNVEVLHGYDFEDGSQLWIASEKFDSAFSDSDWEETGIIPDVHAYAEWDTFYFDTDPSIAAALELLGH